MLNRHEKLAIFNLSILAIGIILFFLFFQTRGIGRSSTSFGILGFLWVGNLLFLRKKTPSEVIEDERDASIKLISLKGALSFVFGYFVITSLAIYYSHHEAGVVSIEYFPVFVWVGWALLVLVSSIITLIQYRRGTNCGIC